MQTTLASAARSRLETIFRRGFPAVASVLFLETAVNMFAQRTYLNSLSDLYFAFVIAAIALSFYTAWRSDSAKWPIALFTLISGLGLLIWPWLLTTGTNFPEGYQPWFWWLLGIAGVGASVAFPTWLAMFYIFLTSAFWIPLHASIAGGNAGLANALQDAIYLFLIGNSLLAVIWMIRDAARKTDEANSSALAREIERAKVDAVERERLRLDALVHDTVLNALLTAANATNAKDRESAAKLAKQAIDSLESAREDRSTGVVNPQGLFRALEIATTRLSPTISVNVLSATLMELPAEVATALTEATLQALDNSLRHAQASAIELNLSATAEGGLEIQVTDNGKGFKPERISKNRIGLRTSIFNRAESVGAKVNLESNLGLGTKIEIRWQQ